MALQYTVHNTLVMNRGHDLASADQETAPPLFMGTLISLSRQKRPCRIHLLAVSEYLALKVSSALAHCVSISEAVSLESALSCGWTILEKTLASLLIGLSEFRKNASALVRGIRCRHKNTNKAGLPPQGRAQGRRQPQAWQVSTKRPLLRHFEELDEFVNMKGALSEIIHKSNGNALVSNHPKATPAHQETERSNLRGTSWRCSRRPNRCKRYNKW